MSEEKDLFEEEKPTGAGGGKSKWIIIGVIVVAVIVAVSLLVAKRDDSPKLSLEDVNTDVQGLLVSYNKTTTKLTNTRTVVATHTEDISDINKDLREMQDKVDALADPVNYQPQINSLNTRLASLNATISACNCSANVTCNYTDWQPQIDELIADIAALNATINEWEAPEIDIPYALVTGKTIDTVRVKVYGTEEATVVATIFGTNLPAAASTSSGSILSCVGGNTTLVVAVSPPIDKWAEGGIIDISIGTGAIAFAFASIGA